MLLLRSANLNGAASKRPQISDSAHIFKLVVIGCLFGFNHFGSVKLRLFQQIGLAQNFRHSLIISLAFWRDMASCFTHSAREPTMRL